MELKIRSKAKKYAKVITFVPLALAIVLGCVWWVSHRSAGYSAILGGIALTPIVWLVLHAIVKELDGVVWVVSSSGITIQKKGEEDRVIPWDTVSKVEMVGAGVNLHLKPQEEAAQPEKAEETAAEKAEDAEKAEQPKPAKTKQPAPPEEIRIGFVAQADAAIVAACHQQPSLLEDDGKGDGADIAVGPSSAQKMTKAFAAVVCLALGAYAGVKGIGTVRHHSQSSNWSKATAVVSKSEIKTEEIEDAKRTINSLDIQYEYVVDGESYSSTRATAWSPDLAGFDQIAEQYVKKYPVGSEVEIFYNPDDPKQSVITPGVDSVVSTAGIVVGFPLFAIGLLLAVSLLRVGFVPSRENVKNHLAAQPA